MIWLSFILVGVGIIYLLMPDKDNTKNSKSKAVRDSDISSKAEILESGDIVR